VFTVDVEEYFQVHAFEGLVAREAWDSFPSRVERNTGAVLDTLDRWGARGTFFVLGWVAKRHPRLVRRIAQSGHEVASHGWSHRKVTSLTPEEFRKEVRSSRNLLEDLTGTRIWGFRAPSFSVVPGVEWAFDVLLEEGYRYDSSVFPVHRLGNCFPGAPREPHLLVRPSGELLELPMATLTVGGLSVPAAGGAYFRHWPYQLVRQAFRQLSAKGGPGVFYIHPWEVDPGQPRLAVGPLARLRHYRGLARTAAALERLLGEFAFTSAAVRFGLAESKTGPDPAWGIPLVRGEYAVR